MKNVLTLVTVFVITMSVVYASVRSTGLIGPDVSIEAEGEILASSVCGFGYFASHTATRADFQNLLRKTKKICEEPTGDVSSYRNTDGELQHVVIIGDEDIIRKPGTEFNTCVINWELDQVTAFKAFEDICLNRKF